MATANRRNARTNRTGDRAATSPGKARAAGLRTASAKKGGGVWGAIKRHPVRAASVLALGGAAAYLTARTLRARSARKNGGRGTTRA